MPREAAKRLSKNADEVIERWEERARKEIAIAGQQESFVLRDSLPDFLKFLIEALILAADKNEARQKASLLEAERIGKKHGVGRAGILGYTLTQLISEYHILRQVIVDVLEREGPISPIAREVIVSCVEQGVNYAAAQFSDSLAEMQERLSDALAHDLRGPITAAKTSAQLIMKHPEQESNCIKLANRIFSDMNRLDSMIRDLLDASRLKAGQKLPLRFAESDLESIVRHVADDANMSHGDRIKVRSTGPCLGLWDENALHRVVENLVTNAVKYGAPDKPIQVEIAQFKDEVLLSVHNEGNPISESDQANLFQAFRRRASDPGKKGWGLGLALVKGIVEAHSGSIRLESGKGSKGTTFTVRLPRRSREALAA